MCEYGGQVSVQDLGEALEALNKKYGDVYCDLYYKNLIPSKKEKVIAKCDKYQFWLFWNKDLCTDHIRGILEEKGKLSTQVGKKDVAAKTGLVQRIRNGLRK